MRVKNMKPLNLLKNPCTWIIALIFLIAACGDKTMDTMDQKLQSKSVSGTEWRKLAAKRIYFGHQSVGYNIIDGIKVIMKGNPAIRLNIRETADASAFNNGVLAHSPNGENVKPKSKVDAFVKTMDSGLAKQVDIAFFKFCYVDFNKDTDVTDVFRYYVLAMDAIKKKYPKVTFLHMTVPLTTEGELLGIRTRVKEQVKMIMGRETELRQSIDANIKRNEFNNLLRKKYGSSYLIDLEQFESTNTDGTLYTSAKGGVKHSVMVPAYTYDGGHLNDLGKTVIADRFLTRLVKQ